MEALPTLDTFTLLTFVAALAPLGVTVKVGVEAPSSSRPFGRNGRAWTFPVLIIDATPERAEVTESTRSPASTADGVAPSSTNTIHPLRHSVLFTQLVPFVLGHITTLRDDLMASERASCRLLVRARVALSRLHWRSVSEKLGIASVVSTATIASVTINSIKVKPC